MKKTIIILTAVLFSSLTFANNTAENNLLKGLELNIAEDRYPVVATTEKGYGTEYSIGATVYASYYSSTPSKVVVEGREVRFSVDYNRSNWYYFSYGTEVYYFKFSK